MISKNDVETYEDVVQLAEEDEVFFSDLMINPENALRGLPNLNEEAAEAVQQVITESIGANRKGAMTWLHGLLHSGVWRRR